MTLNTRILEWRARAEEAQRKLAEAEKQLDWWKAHAATVDLQAFDAAALSENRGSE